jgi:2,3-bisphosphoglycerate-dependent phosphoglycerate mutase
MVERAPALSSFACRAQPGAKLIIHSWIVDDQPEHAKTLWLVQHGQTTWNSMGWVQGHVDQARFTRKGRREICHAANRLAGEEVVAVYSSDLLQARRTAMTIARRLKCDLRTDPRLRERNFGIAEGVRWVDVPAAATGVVGEHIVDEAAHPPGGESLRDLYLRCLGFLVELGNRSSDGNAVVVAHDGSIRMLRGIIEADELAGIELAGMRWESSPQQLVQPVALGVPLQLDPAS